MSLILVIYENAGNSSGAPEENMSEDGEMLCSGVCVSVYLVWCTVRVCAHTGERRVWGGSRV